MIKTNYTRAFIGDIPRLSRDKQIEICKEAVPELDAIYEPKEFDLYVRNLRSDEVALLARLIALAERKPKGRRPGIAFFLRVMQLRDNCAYIHDVEADIKSTDGQAWYDHVESTANKIMRGRALPKERARELARKSHADRAPGLVDEWLSKAKAKDRKRLASHWRDPVYKNAQEAIAASPDEELKSASVSTWTRIFGRRTVSRKS